MILEIQSILGWYKLLLNKIINLEEIPICDKDLVFRLFGIPWPIIGIIFQFSDLFSIGRCSKEKWTPEIYLHMYIWGRGECLFDINSTCYANKWIFNDQWKVRILGPESSPENINCFDDQWTIIRWNILLLKHYHQKFSKFTKHVHLICNIF